MYIHGAMTHVFCSSPSYHHVFSSSSSDYKVFAHLHLHLHLITTYPSSSLLPQVQLDDVVAAVPMHLGCGAMGTLFVGLFAREEFVKDFYGVNPAGAVCGS